jgi:predicted NUDIX family phosphoesterase
MAQVESECVLVVPTTRFHGVGLFQGFSPDVDRYLDALFNTEHTSYRPRGEVEQDPSYKQLIPYVILRSRDVQGREVVFQYTRGKGQGESRLHSKKSVGIGGHISAGDHSDEPGTDAANAAYLEGMRRELAEEVEIDSPYAERCVGLINDDSTEVGSVHLGVVHVFDLERPRARPLETDIANAEFQPIEAIMAEIQRYESWSQICLRALFGEH